MLQHILLLGACLFATVSAQGYLVEPNPRQISGQYFDIIRSSLPNLPIQSPNDLRLIPVDVLRASLSHVGIKFNMEHCGGAPLDAKSTQICRPGDRLRIVWRVVHWKEAHCKLALYCPSRHYAHVLWEGNCGQRKDATSKEVAIPKSFTGCSFGECFIEWTMVTVERDRFIQCIDIVVSGEPSQEGDITCSPGTIITATVTTSGITTSMSTTTSTSWSSIVSEPHTVITSQVSQTTISTESTSESTLVDSTATQTEHSETLTFSIPDTSVSLPTESTVISSFETTLTFTTSETEPNSVTTTPSQNPTSIFTFETTPTPSTETPSLSTETLITSTETPPPNTETPTHVTETPIPSTETPPPSTETPPPSTETPILSTETPTPSTETPISCTKIPTASTETPTHITETPIPSTETLMPSTETPVSSTMPVTPSTETPMPCTKTPTPSTETVTFISSETTSLNSTTAAPITCTTENNTVICGTFTSIISDHECSIRTTTVTMTIEVDHIPSIPNETITFTLTASSASPIFGNASHSTDRMGLGTSDISLD